MTRVSREWRRAGLLGMTMVLGAALAGCSGSAASSTSETSSGGGLDFASAVLYTAGGGTGPQQGALGDLDGDGYTDLAVANTDTQTLTLYRGTGSGTFTLLRNEPLGFSPTAVVEADLNGDGHLDLAVAGGATLGILLGDGTGNLPTFAPLALGVSLKGLAVADLDDDGYQDVACVNTGGAPVVAVFGGTGLPSGWASASWQTSSGTVNDPVAVQVEDFNLDGRVDLALANGAASYLTLWLNAGGDRASLFPDGNTRNSGLTLPDGHTGLFVATAFLNGDSRPDWACVSTNGTDFYARIILNTAQGVGTNTLGTRAVSPDSRGVGTADFNSDGYVDVVVASLTGLNQSGTGEADILATDGTGNMSEQVRFPVQEGMEASCPLAADLDGDGRPDLVMVGPGGACVLMNQTQ